MAAKLGLLPKIGIGIVAGIGLGFVSPMWLTQIFATFNGIFSQFLGFMIPMIILGFVIPAIADIGSNAGELLVVTAVLAYVATFLAGLLSYTAGVLTFPSLIAGEQSMAVIESSGYIEPYFEVAMPPLMDVVSALVLSFVMGLGIAFLKGEVLRKSASEFRDIVAKTINVAVIPLLPIYIFGIFLIMTVEGQVGTILKCFAKIIVIIFILHILVLVIQYCLASLFSKQNPFSMLRTMMPAYFTALGTQSSAATIPVTLRQAIKMGVSEDIAGFVIPLCATIHMSGSTLKIVACALALTIMYDQPHNLGIFCHFIAMLGVTIIAAPGIPGGAIMASIGLLKGILGFDEATVAMMIALYIAMDSFGTACNVTGDGALAAIINRLFPKEPAITIKENA